MNDSNQPQNGKEYWVVRCPHCGQLFCLSTSIPHMGEGVLVGHTDAFTGQGCGKHSVIKEGMFSGPHPISMLVWQ